MRIPLLALLVLTLFPAGPAGAQPDDDSDVPTVVIEGAGLDIWGGATDPGGRLFRGRSPAEFPMLLELERDFVGEIAEDAERAELR